MNMRLNDLLPKLKDPKPDGKGGYMAFCPCHDDGRTRGRRSLHVWEEDGRLCIHCFAGCKYEDIKEPLGLNDSRSKAPNKPEATFDYVGEKDKLLFQVVRFRGKRFSQRRPDGNGNWVWGLSKGWYEESEVGWKKIAGAERRDKIPKPNAKWFDSVERVIYRLPEVHEAIKAGMQIYCCEGEKDCDRLASLGLMGTTNPGGAGKWKPIYNESLRKARVAIIPDNDDPGKKHALNVARHLHGIASEVKIVYLPGLPPKEDISFWLSNGGTSKKLQELTASAPIFESSSEHEDLTTMASDEGEKGKLSQADIIVKIVDGHNVELFHDPFREPYAQVKIEDHQEIHKVNSSLFRRWVAGIFWQCHAKVPNSEAIANALRVIEAKACIQGPERKLYNRVARTGDAIYYDLADPAWKVIEITADGWKILAEAPVLFRRFEHQLPQVMPESGGDVREVLRFMNVRDENDQLLVLIDLIASFIPDIPHPIPNVWGEQGSGKSQYFKIKKRVVDPSKAETLSFPRDTSELVQKLAHHWVACFDNISHIPPWIADVLCRAVSGEGFSKRKLYSDDEDIIYSFRRCIGLNGVNIASARPDLLDRSILFGFERIPKKDRRPEEELDREFEAMKGRILGGIFDVLAQVIGIRKKIKLSEYPRLADFALWGCAIAEAMGYSQKDFEEAYWGNIQQQNREAIEAHPVGTALLHFLRDKPTWEGTPSQLLKELEGVATDLKLDTRARKWPKAPHILSRRINEVRTNMREEGWEITDAHSGTREIRIYRTPQSMHNSVHTVHSVQGQVNQRLNPDATADATDATEKVASTPNPLNSKGLDAMDSMDATFPTPSGDEEEGLWEG